MAVVVFFPTIIRAITIGFCQDSNFSGSQFLTQAHCHHNTRWDRKIRLRNKMLSKTRKIWVGMLYNVHSSICYVFQSLSDNPQKKLLISGFEVNWKILHSFVHKILFIEDEAAIECSLWIRPVRCYHYIVTMKARADLGCHIMQGAGLGDSQIIMGTFHHRKCPKQWAGGN